MSLQAHKDLEETLFHEKHHRYSNLLSTKMSQKN